MSPDSQDSSTIRSIAVTARDVVAALEMNQTTSRRAVLRVTPPFSGRMRARIHVAGTDEYTDEPQPLHVDPASLVSADAPSVPRATETEATLRREPAETYSVERHHEYHTERVRAWRATIPEHILDRVTLRTPGGDHPAEVRTLGTDA